MNAFPWGLDLYNEALLWAFSYVGATLYFTIWDVRMDWGMFPTTETFFRKQRMCAAQRRGSGSCLLWFGATLYVTRPPRGGRYMTPEAPKWDPLPIPVVLYTR